MSLFGNVGPRHSPRMNDKLLMKQSGVNTMDGKAYCGEKRGFLVELSKPRLIPDTLST